jgi:anti-anti-sigma factor
MQETWNYSAGQADGVCTFALSGELDISGSEELFRAFVEALSRPGIHTVQADLRAVNFLDSSGLWALLTAHHAAQALNRRFFVSRAHGRVLRALEVAGVLPILSPEAAVTRHGRVDRPAG